MRYARFWRWTVLPALTLVIASSALTPVGLAAEDNLDTSTVVATTASAAPVSQMEPGNCSFIAPCVVGHSSIGMELDTGGPALRIERFADDD